MKAITICQPYAALIMLPDEHDRAKRVENRTWPTSYRGPLLIHAGKSRQWLNGDNYGLDVSTMDFGAIVGVAQLRDCVQCHSRTTFAAFSSDVSRRWPWLSMHEHAEGPWCWVLTQCRRFDEPIPYRGAQGLFEIPREVVEAQLNIAAAT